MEGNLTKGPIMKTLVKLAVPIMASAFLGTLYNITDMAWIGLLGSKAVAGVGVGGMFTWLSQGLASMARMGGQVQVAQCIGRGDREKAHGFAQAAVQLSAAMGIAYAVLCLIFVNQMVGFFRLEDAEAQAAALAYTKIACGLIVFSFLTLTLTGLYTAQGDSKTPFMANLIGLMTNMILDPVFIFGLRMGISGAAAATVISQCVSFCILFFQCNFRKGCIRLRPGKFTPSLKIYGEILHAGLPSLCRQGLASAAAVALNVAANPFGDAAIAAMSIVTRYMMFINSALIGFGQGFQPVCGFNFGAKRYDRVLEAFWFCLKVAVILLTTLGVISFFGAEAIMGLFRKGDLEVIGIGTWAMRFQCLTLPFQAWIIMSNMLTQSIGYGFRASIVAAGRQGIFLIPALLTLPRFLGILGLQLCQPIADVCTSVMAAVIVVSILKELKVWNEEIQNLSKKTMDE